MAAIQQSTLPVSRLQSGRAARTHLSATDPPEDLNKDLQQVEKLISGEINTYSMEKRYYNRNGDVVWALLAVSLVRHTDGTAALFYRSD
ncbi:PAS domain S-box protein [Escherichia coli]|nr:PAS domain S-box protein [Escherichia coli]